RLLLHGGGVVDFDLARDEAKLVYSSYPSGPTLPREAALCKEQYQWIGQARALQGDWLWTADAFGRMGLKERARERFPPPARRRGVPEFSADRRWEFVGPDGVLAADLWRLVLLELKPIP